MRLIDADVLVESAENGLVSLEDIDKCPSIIVPFLRDHTCISCEWFAEFGEFVSRYCEKCTVSE